jgi:hypothetical protein
LAKPHTREDFIKIVGQKGVLGDCSVPYQRRGGVRDEEQEGQGTRTGPACKTHHRDGGKEGKSRGRNIRMGQMTGF